VLTYNYKHPDGRIEHGGYSSHIVVDQDYVLRVPSNLPLDVAAPLLCAGITTYSPLIFYGLNQKGMHVGVLGLGGLGHMAVKFAKAFGCQVTVLSRSPNKKQEALALGADHFVISTDEAAMKAAADSMDGIVDTVSAEHSLSPYLPLLKVGGKVAVVGVPSVPFTVHSFELVMRRITIGGSLIGGIKETQEMLDFCGQHNIAPSIEVIKADYVNEAWDRTVASDVKFRFVIDVQASIVHNHK
jgi:cinnamyl-alcohol dehydrogenase